MSSYRRIKLFYTLTFTIFHFILWGIISFFLNNRVDYRLFIIAMAAVLLMQLLLSKELNSYKTMGFPIAAVLPVLYFVYGKNGTLINTVFVILNTFLLFNQESERIDYGAYSIKIKRSTYMLAAAGLLLFFADEQLRSNLLRFYMIFLIMGIWLLREVRNYTYRIYKRSLWGNISIVLLVLALTMESVYKLIALVLGRTLQGFNFIIDKLILFTAVIFVKCFGGIMEFLSYKLRNVKPQSLNLSPALTEKKDTEIISQAVEISPVVRYGFKVLMITLTCYMAYRIIKKYRKLKAEEYSEIQESREKITRKSSSKVRFGFDKLKDRFRAKDLKQQALDIFKAFQVKTYKKDIFKEFMAAQELGELTGEKLHNMEDTKRLAELYNSSKFSRHEVNEHNVSEMKNIFNRIKDNVDKL
jgi:hypothetical protein